MASESAYRCTLPECQCEEFTAGKSQFKTCDECRHGWIAHDFITETQAKKIRKRGTKDGTPCQMGACACGNYQRPPGATKTSWFAMCENCRHSETEHRYPTKLDKTKKHNQEKAGDHACVGCEAKCPGFIQLEDGGSSQKCGRCRHAIETHRQDTNLDHFILDEIESCLNKRCHYINQTSSKQSKSSNWQADVDNNAFLDAWVEPTNIDHDEDVGFLDPNVCQCRGFVADDMARIFNQYFGFTESIVAPHLPSLACQQCSHPLKNHRHHNEKELQQLALRKQNNLTTVGIISMDAVCNHGYQNNVSISLHKEDKADHGFKVMLATMCAQRSSDGSGGYSNYISIGSTIFPYAQHDDHRRLHSASSHVDDESRSEDEKENDGDRAEKGAKKRGRKMTKIVDDVKRKIKRRKIGSKSKTLLSGSESDILDDEDPASVMSRSLGRLADEAACITGQRSNVTVLAWSQQTISSSRLAVASDDKTIVIYQGANDVLSEAYFPEGIGICTCLSWSHCGKWLVSGHTCGTSLVWNVPDTPQQALESSTLSSNSAMSRVSSISISGDDRLIAVGNQCSTVAIHEVKRVTVDNTHTINCQLISTCSILYGAVLSLAWHPSKLLLVAGGEDDQCTVFHMKKPANQTSRGSLKHFFTRSPRRPTKKGFHQCAILKGHKSFVGALAFSSCGQFLVTAGWDGQLLFWDVNDMDDAIESEDNVRTEIVCSSGFVMGRSLRGTSLGEMHRPFVPQSVILFGTYVLFLMRTSVNRVTVILYEIPHKYINSPLAEECIETK